MQHQFTIFRHFLIRKKTCYCGAVYVITLKIQLPTNCQCTTLPRIIQATQTSSFGSWATLVNILKNYGLGEFLTIFCRMEFIPAKFHEKTVHFRTVRNPIMIIDVRACFVQRERFWNKFQTNSRFKTEVYVKTEVYLNNISDETLVHLNWSRWGFSAVSFSW